MNNKTVRSRNRKIFITSETAAGTPDYPAATDAFLANEVASFSQETETAEVDEYTDQLLAVQEVVTGFGYANPTMTIHPRFGAAVGDLPPEQLLLKNFFGECTQTAGTSVKYTFADTDDTLCAWHQYTDVLQQVACGMVVSEMNFTIGKKALMAYEFTMMSNQIMNNSQCEIPAGTASIPAGANVMVDVDTQGVYVANVGSKFDVYDTSGAKVDSDVEVVSTNGTQIEFLSTGVQYDAGFVLKPTLPAGTYSTQVPFAPTKASVYVGPANETLANLTTPANGYAFTTREISVNMNKNLQTPTEDELNGSLYGGASYEIDKPRIEISTTLNMLPGTARLYEVAKQDMLRSIAIEIPHQARKMVVYLPEVFMVVSDGGDNAGAAQQSVTFRNHKSNAVNDAGRFEFWLY